MVSEAMPLVVLPISDVKIFIVVKAFALLAVPGIFLPVAMVLIACCLLSVCADVGSLAIPLLHCVYISLISISIGILNPDDVPFFAALVPGLGDADPALVLPVDSTRLVIA
jgi:hypothetical protein